MSLGRSLETQAYAGMIADAYQQVMTRFQARLSAASEQVGLSHVLQATSGPNGRIALCVDGRPITEPIGIIQKEERIPIGERRIHFPGGVYGVFVAVTKQHPTWTADEAVDTVRAALGQDVWLHTDDHSKDRLVGCAYAKALMNPQTIKQIDPTGNVERAKEIWDRLYPQALLAEYIGSHKEGAAFIVQSSDFTVMSPHGENQAFVYDQARMREWVGEFSQRLHTLGVAIDTKQLWMDLDAQAINSLLFLTAPVDGSHDQLPVYEIGTQAGTVVIRTMQ